MLDACMRWLFQLPLHSNCPLLHSLLLLWHTCCAYGIATNAFADVAHKLEVMFKAGHYAYEVMLRCTHTHTRARTNTHTRAHARARHHSDTGSAAVLRLHAMCSTRARNC